METYGCVAGYPNGSFRGNRAITRYEAAALLNACLDRITEVTDELRRLLGTKPSWPSSKVALTASRPALASWKQPVSTTTKLKGKSTFVLGAVKANSSVGQAADDYNAALGGTTFNYDLQLALDTSFTGKDLLRTRLRAGNFGGSVFGDGLTTLETAYSSDNVVEVDRLFYRFPVGGNVTAIAGARVRQDDMLAVWPSAYPSDTILDLFTYAGAPAAYNLAVGAGAGLFWADNGWSASASYLSTNGNQSDPGTGQTNSPCIRASTGGIATDCAGSNGTVQLAYTAEQWGVAAAYNYASGNNGVRISSSTGTPFAVSLAATGVVNSFGLSGYWSPEESGWIPSISSGWGISTTTGWDGDRSSRPTILSTNDRGVDSYTSQSWYLGLEWSDVLLEGNSAGMAVGQATFVTGVDYSDESSSDWVGDGNYAWEWWYKFQVTDNISVTPALFYLSAPRGQDFRDNNAEAKRSESFSNFGGLIKTTFLF